ncbi:hypothetical protein NIES2101_42440 [Calothrix sp. HK-06]|nr:hypothetical protein NIES2101_42440 [Calothrix sp. HK-06]
MATTAFIVLKEGSTGAEVTKLQQRLKTLNAYTGAADGSFGTQTKAAVIKFQQNNAVVADGIVGYETEFVLERALWVAQRANLKEGTTDNDVKLLQSLLLQDVENSGDATVGVSVKYAIDGVFGPQTTKNVVRFQTKRNLKADGIVGAATWKALSGVLAFDLSPESIVVNKVFGIV